MRAERVPGACSRPPTARPASPLVHGSHRRASQNGGGGSSPQRQRRGSGRDCRDTARLRRPPLRRPATGSRGAFIPRAYTYAVPHSPRRGGHARVVAPPPTPTESGWWGGGGTTAVPQLPSRPLPSRPLLPLRVNDPYRRRGRRRPRLPPPPGSYQPAQGRTYIHTRARCSHAASPGAPPTQPSLPPLAGTAAPTAARSRPRPKAYRGRPHVTNQ